MLLPIQIRYVTLLFRDRRGAASLRYLNSAEISLFMFEQKAYFRAGAKAFRYSSKVISHLYQTMVCCLDHNTLFSLEILLWKNVYQH